MKFVNLYTQKRKLIIKIRFFDIKGMLHKHRSSLPKVFRKNHDFKGFTKFTGKDLCRSLVLNKTACHSWLKGGSNTGIFL